MTNPSIQLSEVVYNAATQSFEARATVYAPEGARVYACAIDAPITMTFADAASGLSKQALRRHTARGGLRARIIAPARAVAARARARRRMDPFAMLRRLAA
ncbi:MAG: orotidine 5-phosphate decarboxylase [Pseudomonadota bacterium]